MNLYGEHVCIADVTYSANVRICSMTYRPTVLVKRLMSNYHILAPS